MSQCKHCGAALSNQSQEFCAASCWNEWRHAHGEELRTELTAWAAHVEATLECRVALVEFDERMATVGFRTDGDVDAVREALREHVPMGYALLVEPGF